MAAVEPEISEGKRDEAKENEKEFHAMAGFAESTSSRSGGVYMPPARLRAPQLEGRRGTGLQQCRIPTSLLRRPAQVDRQYRQRGQRGQHQTFCLRVLL